MCAVSFIGDHYRDKWDEPDWGKIVQPIIHPVQPFSVKPVSQEDFDKLKADVAEMKKLLKRAKDYDEQTGQPDCETDEKMALLRKVAEAVGIDLDDVLGNAGS